MRRNIPDNSSQYTTFIHFMPTFLSGRVCCGQDYPGGSAVKNPPAMQEPQETMFSPSVGKSPGEHGNPLQYSCLENPIDRGVWWVKELNTTEATQHTCMLWTKLRPQTWCICRHACMCKNVLILIVIGLVLNINFKLIVHSLCFYIMFLLISSFIFQKILRKKM